MKKIKYTGKCQHCGHPVDEGFCCEYCGSSNPTTDNQASFNV
jgi:rRNA maturation endonuclease Nob1